MARVGLLQAPARTGEGGAELRRRRRPTPDRGPARRDHGAGRNRLGSPSTGSDRGARWQPLASPHARERAVSPCGADRLARRDRTADPSGSRLRSLIAASERTFGGHSRTLAQATVLLIELLMTSRGPGRVKLWLHGAGGGS